MTPQYRRLQVRTIYDPKPGGFRGRDWEATREGWEPGELVGYGATEASARADLEEQERQEFNE